MGAERTKWTSLVYSIISLINLFTPEKLVYCVFITLHVRHIMFLHMTVVCFSVVLLHWRLLDWTNESINVTQMLHKFVQKEREELVPHSSLSQLHSCDCLASSLGLHQSWCCILSPNFHRGSWDCSTLLNEVSSCEVQWFSMHLWSTTVITLCFANFNDLACFQSIS